MTWIDTRSRNGIWVDERITEEPKLEYNKTTGIYSFTGDVVVINRFIPFSGRVEGGDGNEHLGVKDWFDKTIIGIESYSFAHSSKEELIKYAAKTDPSLNNLKYVKGVKVVGKVLVVAGTAATMYEAYDDAFNKGSYYSAGTRLAVAGVAAGAAFIPFVGWGIAGGIGIADAIWGDQFYNWVELNMGQKP